MKVQIERKVEQVVDGTHYKGHLKIAETVLHYELRFAIPIPRLDDMKPLDGADEVRRTFQITVKRDDANVELTDEEYCFFFNILMEFAVSFYHNPQTRDSQEGLTGMGLRGEGLMSTFASISIGITHHCSFDFEPEICEMLSSPKFDCALVA